MVEIGLSNWRNRKLERVAVDRAVDVSLADDRLWLKPECDRRVQVRARRKAHDRRLAEWAAETLVDQNAQRQAREAESNQAISWFSEGMQVKANAKDHARGVRPA
ncbi:MAG TPA: hypothetical protein VFQ37_16470 [Mycobacterium sp.]|nr:hypothetical protein [Mycobacterium sp.]